MMKNPLLFVLAAFFPMPLAASESEPPVLPMSETEQQRPALPTILPLKERV